jgi:hypothetical protein
MVKFVKFVAAAIIIFAFIFGAIIGWKIVDNIRQDVRKDLQGSFKESLCEYGKR